MPFRYQHNFKSYVITKRVFVVRLTRGPIENTTLFYTHVGLFYLLMDKSLGLGHYHVVIHVNDNNQLDYFKWVIKIDN